MSLGIAIVDDDEAILDSLQLLLEDHGWRVWTYPTGEAFLFDHESLNLDCLILDPHLPGLSGGEVARRVRSGEREIPILGLSARPYSPLAGEVMDAGALAMMKKPASEGELIVQIKSAMKRIYDGE